MVIATTWTHRIHFFFRICYITGAFRFWFGERVRSSTCKHTTHGRWSSGDAIEAILHRMYPTQCDRHSGVFCYINVETETKKKFDPIFLEAEFNANNPGLPFQVFYDTIENIANLMEHILAISTIKQNKWGRRFCYEKTKMILCAYTFLFRILVSFAFFFVQAKQRNNTQSERKKKWS